MKKILFLFMTCMFVCLGFTIDAGNQYYILYQECLDGSEPIEGLMVEATSISGSSQVYSVTTSFDGIARISVPAGQKYRISATYGESKKEHDTNDIVLSDQTLTPFIW